MRPRWRTNGQQGGGDLTGELTRRREHQRGRTTALRRGQPSDERQPERQRLAGAGRGTAGDIAAGERVGENGGLDGRRGGDADLIENGAQVGGNAERAEIRRGRGHWGETASCGSTSAFGRNNGASARGEEVADRHRLPVAPSSHLGGQARGSTPSTNRGTAPAKMLRSIADRISRRRFPGRRSGPCPPRPGAG